MKVEILQRTASSDVSKRIAGLNEKTSKEQNVSYERFGGTEAEFIEYCEKKLAVLRNNGGGLLLYLDASAWLYPSGLSIADVCADMLGDKDAAVAAWEYLVYSELNRTQKFVDFNVDVLAETRGKLDLVNRRLQEIEKDAKSLVSDVNENKAVVEEMKKRVNLTWLDTVAIKDACSQNAAAIRSALDKLEEEFQSVEIENDVDKL